jgi:hypothetical protein
MSKLRISLAALAVLVTLSGVGLTLDNIHWKNIGPGAGGNMFVSAVSPDDPRIVLFGSDVGGIYRSQDSGQTWSIRNNALVAPAAHSSYNMQDGSFAFAPDGSGAHNIVYFGSMKSLDAGLTWTEMLPPNGLYRGRTTVDPGNPLVVYVAEGVNLYKTTDGFATGTYQTKTCLPGAVVTNCANLKIRSLVIDPASTNHLLACVSQDSAACSGPDCGLYESTDGADHWTKLDPSNGNLSIDVPPNFQCNGLALHADTRTLYMTINTLYSTEASGWRRVETWKGGVYKSAASSSWHTWSAVNGGVQSNGEDLEHSDLYQGSGGFEQPLDLNQPPTGWTYSGTLARASTTGHGGATVAVKTGTGVDNPFGILHSSCVAVQGGKVYELAAWGKLDNYASCATNITFQGQMTFFSDSQCSSLLPFPGMGTTAFNSNTFVDFSKIYDPAVNNGWRKFMTLVTPPTEQVVYVGLQIGAMQIMPNCPGQTYIDDVTFRQVESLPKVGGRSDENALVNYDPIVVDPEDVNTVYVGTQAAGSTDYQLTNTGGVWKARLDGQVTHWSHVTESNHGDNVEDGILSAPQCGNGKCEGRWENCNTCPADCSVGFPLGTCCGNNQIDPNETVDNCRVDVPPYSVVGRSYYEFDGNGYAVNTISIGKDEPPELSSTQPGHLTLYMGSSEPYVTINGGGLWKQASSDYASPPAVPEPSWAARGDATDVDAGPVVADHRGGNNRLFYGDFDNQLQVSYDGGGHFAKEGQPWLPFGQGGDSVSSIVLDPLDANVVYLGIGSGDSNYQLFGGAAILKGTFTPGLSGAVGRWSWEAQGTNLPTNANVDLIRTNGVGANARFIASVYGYGIYRLDDNNVWTQDFVTWVNRPAQNRLHRLVQEPTQGRLYVAADEIFFLDPNDDYGVWEGAADGLSWCKINGTSLPNIPILDIATNGPNALLVGTGVSAALGGVYRGNRTGNCAWSWERVLALPQVTSVVVSPASSAIVYALAAQINGTDTNNAGIYKSTQGGAAGSWSLLPNDGLMYLGTGRLSFSDLGESVLYDATFGNGVYEGTMTCGHAIAPENASVLSSCFDGIDNDCDGVVDLDCAASVLPGPDGQQETSGSIISGSESDLTAASVNNSYEALNETLSGVRKLNVLWSIPTANTIWLSGTNADLRVEGFRNASANDNFLFSASSHVGSAKCDSLTEGGGATTLVTLQKTSDNDQAQIADLGLSTGTFCIKVQGSKDAGSDGMSDTLTLDRLFVFPTPVALSDLSLMGIDIGTVTGTFAETQKSDNLRQTLAEATSNNAYRLSHTWQFQNVPAGTAHKLHFEGYVTHVGMKQDNFKFSWSTSPTGMYTSISGATVSSATETSIDSSTFAPGISGTIYIRVEDSQVAQTSNYQSTLQLDHLVIKTSP